MQDLSFEDQLRHNYNHVLEQLKGKYPGIEVVKVDVSTDNGEICLSIGEHKVYMTPEQAVDLMQELRRSVVKTKPKALHKK